MCSASITYYGCIERQTSISDGCVDTEQLKVNQFVDVQDDVRVVIESWFQVDPHEKHSRSIAGIIPFMCLAALGVPDGGFERDATLSDLHT